MKSVEELDEMREEREINKQTMSALVGYRNNEQWGHAVREGFMSPEKRRIALDVFQYYDERGYVPTPWEVPL